MPESSLPAVLCLSSTVDSGTMLLVALGTITLSLNSVAATSAFGSWNTETFPPLEELLPLLEELLRDLSFFYYVVVF